MPEELLIILGAEHVICISGAYMKVHRAEIEMGHCHGQINRCGKQSGFLVERYKSSSPLENLLGLVWSFALIRDENMGLGL